MIESYKILAQSHPSAGNLVDLYQSPPLGLGTVISSIAVCITNSPSDLWRVSNAVNGAADDIKQYIYYDDEIDYPDTFIATIGITIAPGDVIRVRSANGKLSFNLYGTELS